MPLWSASAVSQLPSDFQMIFIHEVVSSLGRASSSGAAYWIAYEIIARLISFFHDFPASFLDSPLLPLSSSQLTPAAWPRRTSSEPLTLLPFGVRSCLLFGGDSDAWGYSISWFLWWTCDVMSRRAVYCLIFMTIHWFYFYCGRKAADW